MARSLLIAAALVASPAIAQTAAPATTPSTPAVQSDPAAELVGLLGIEKQLDFVFSGLMPLMTENIAAAIGNSGVGSAELRAQLANEAGRAHAKGIIGDEVMKGFQRRYPRIKAETAKLYSDAFTETELRDLITFYRSPAGAKLLKTQPDIQQKMGKIGERIGMEVGMEVLPQAIEKLEGAPPKQEVPRT